jgi:hypothetical protein
MWGGVISDLGSLVAVQHGFILLHVYKQADRQEDLARKNIAVREQKLSAAADTYRLHITLLCLCLLSDVKQRGHNMYDGVSRDGLPTERHPEDAC